MTAVVTLEPPALELAPGEEARCSVQIRNTGDLVEAYQLEVVGAPAQWASVEPASVSVYPGNEATAEISFRPPRSPRAPAGELPFAVRVVPTEHPEEVTVPEGTVLVGGFVDTTAEIIPRTSRGRFWARHKVAVDNRGNVPLQAALSGGDPDGMLNFRTRPDALVVGPGQAAFATLAVRPRKPLWRGEPVTMPFQTVVRTEEQPDLVLDGTMLQLPVLPRGTLRALAALLALLALWFLVLKPTIASAARDAVAQPVAAAKKDAANADAAAKKAQAQQDQAAQAAKVAADAAKKANPNAATTIAARPFSQRLTMAAPPNATDSSTFTVPAKQTLTITDVVLQNPQGDTGRLDLLANGKVLLTLALANFRDIDYHFVSPIEVPAGRTVVARMTCQQVGSPLPGNDGSACRSAALVTGTTQRAP
ncbi:MAG TPA: hypothetical protein VGR21_00640 [Cryptosporangiaceae bacterium]|nr:hypothetical protein [Cryptosporangiaceae bacterium]